MKILKKLLNQADNKSNHIPNLNSNTSDAIRILISSLIRMKTVNRTFRNIYEELSIIYNKSFYHLIGI